MNHFVIFYNEIATKGKNRIFFERTLMSNIKKIIGKKIKNLERRHGFIVFEVAKGDYKEEIKENLKNIPGIANFSLAFRSNLNLDDIKKDLIRIAKIMVFKTFKIDSSRSFKKFAFTSSQLNEILGAEVVKALKKEVDLENPQITFYVKISEKDSFIYTEKIQGIGGLPVGCSGNVLCSLSGGIDSPVASFLAMKRGCKVIFVHFFKDNIELFQKENKIIQIVRELCRFQGESKLIIVSFKEIQNEIIKKIRSDFRMIFYRRFMIKILNELAKKEEAKEIITGDNLGQVASQTLDNLNSIYSVAEYPMLAPLIGMNKEEIIRISKSIGLFELSIKDYADCCSFMISPHPKTNSKLEEIKLIEKNINDSSKLIKSAIADSKILFIK